MTEKVKTVVVIARQSHWAAAKETGQYTQSTIDSTLEEVGFIHCSFPNQTLEIANRKFTANDDLMVLLVDTSKVTAPIKYEGALSGRAGTFPHIYGPLNVDAVYDAMPLVKDKTGSFVLPHGLTIAQKNMTHYLVALEIGHTDVGSVYHKGLPLHCTLMHWFLFDGNPSKLHDTVQAVLQGRRPVVLTGGQTSKFGPLPVEVTVVEKTNQIHALHMDLYKALNELGASYTEPQWVGLGYTPHVTKKGQQQLAQGEKVVCAAAYLASADGAAYSRPRKVIAHFSL